MAFVKSYILLIATLPYAVAVIPVTLVVPPKSPVVTFIKPALTHVVRIASPVNRDCAMASATPESVMPIGAVLNTLVRLLMATIATLP